MLKKRIIPCLDIKDGRTVKGVNFVDIRDAGDPIALAKPYVQEGADELVFLDITATIEKRKTLRELVERIAKEINIPFTVGGGINTLEDAKSLILAGADKVTINSSAVRNPKLIDEIAQAFGSQCVVLAIDARQEHDTWHVYVDGGKTATGLQAITWARQGEQEATGEILLTSMNHDGTRDGFAIDLTNAICRAANIPVIASGGAGSKTHFKALFEQSQASAALAASIFHFREIPIPDLKTYLKHANIPVR
jgi:imidazole glycerol-phosphate synthase subunit HisF